MTANGDALDEALERFEHTGPEFGGGLANHGPMAADALVALGRGDAVVNWSEWYVARLTEHPEARNAIDSSSWREALGRPARVGDWVAFFDREMRERPWADVLETWVARLAPGIMAAATHGLLRTAHAVRSLGRGANPLRLHELAEGLGYWAARYQTLPTAPVIASGAMRVADALASVVRLDETHRPVGLIYDAVKAIDAEEFAPIINYVATGGDAGVFVSDLTRTFVRQYLANADRASISFVHTVTAPSALRMLGPHLSDDTLEAVMRYVWQACASIYATYGRVGLASVPAAREPVQFDEADLVERAVSARDEHTIKFTEACLREYAVTPDPAFVVAAEDVVGRLRR